MLNAAVSKWAGSASFFSTALKKSALVGSLNKSFRGSPVLADAALRKVWDAETPIEHRLVEEMRLGAESIEKDFQAWKEAVERRQWHYVESLFLNMGGY